MLSQEEETRILRGIGEIMDNMRHVPVDDVAYFLVKYDPKLAEKLAASIEFEFLEKDYKNVK